MIVKMLSVMMALLLCAGNCGEIEPSHVDLDFTEYGVQITYDDGTGYWLEYEPQCSSIPWRGIDFMETEELFLMDMEESGLTDYVLYDSSELTAEIVETRKRLREGCTQEELDAFYKVVHLYLDLLNEL